MPRIPQIGAPEAGQQTIQLVAGRIRPGPRVKALTPPSTPQSTPAPTRAPGQRHYENNLVRQFAAIHAESLILNPDDPDKVLTRNSYTRELKLAAIQYATTTLVTNKKGVTKLITVYAAAKNLQITYQMMKKWIQKKDEISGQKKGSRRGIGVHTQTGKEHAMELELMRLFTLARQAGRSVGARWFRSNARQIYSKLYPERILRKENTLRVEYLGFKFSASWFRGFRRRFGISLRAKTKQAQKVPEAFREKIQSWLQFNRRQTVIEEFSDQGLPCKVPCVGRFKLSEIANMDQTPIAFEFLTAKTYDFKGSKTVWLKEARSGWDRRQATLQICVFADGIQRSRPLLIFHGAEVGDSRRRVEEREYHQDVVTLYNPTAWATSKTMLYWIQHDYRLCSPFGVRDIEPKLLAIDAFRAHNTTEVMAAFKKLKTTVSLIPGGCTGFVQVLDVALNKPMKMLIAQEADDHYDAHIEQWTAGKYTVGERRIMLTHWVARAWKRLHIEYKDTIITAFRNVGMSLNPNGLEDGELKIKALDGITVGDWHRHDISQTEEQDIVAVQIAHEVEEACQDGTIQGKIRAEKDEEEALELGITKASLRASNAQRSNRYFLAEEEDDDDGSEVTECSESGGSEFDSSDDDDEEAEDHIME
jgi:hypothetical protein